MFFAESDENITCHVCRGDQQQPALRHGLHRRVEHVRGRAERVQVNRLVRRGVLRTTQVSIMPWR